jgi:uncharacterized protein YbjT (DUF2867 family)
MAGRVLLTGASGFVGKAVLGALVERGRAVNALVHRRPVEPVERADVREVRGELADGEALRKAAEGCDAAIHLVGIIAERPGRGVTFERVHVEGTTSVLSACAAAGIRRYVHMSALGTRPDAASEYHRTKWRAEQLVRASGLDWTIIRPSMIHGPGGELMRMVAGWARRQAPPYLFMPYFGRGLLGLGGAGQLQPVYVMDVARALVEALDKPRTIGRTYELGGSERLSWPEFYRAGARAIVGRQRPVLPMPAWLASTIARVVPASLLPFNRDQVIMSQEDNTCDLAPFEADFGWLPEGFSDVMQASARPPAG